VYIESVARDGDLFPKWARDILRDEDVIRLVERTGDTGLSKDEVIDRILEDTA